MPTSHCTRTRRCGQWNELNPKLFLRIHPFNHERRSFPNDIEDLVGKDWQIISFFQQNIGRRGVRAIEEVYGTKYRFGTGADILYPSAGG